MYEDIFGQNKSGDCMGVLDGKTDREMDWKHHSLSNLTIVELLIIAYEHVRDTVRERQRERERGKKGD